MAEFGAAATLTVPDDEIQAARKEIEQGVSDIPVGVSRPPSQQRPSSGGGAGSMGGGESVLALAEERNEYLLEMLEELGEDSGPGGGGGGMAGLGMLGKLGGALGAAGLATAGTAGSVLGLEKMQQSQESGSITNRVTEAVQQTIKNNPGGVSNPMSAPSTLGKEAGNEFVDAATAGLSDVQWLAADNVVQELEGVDWPSLPDLQEELQNADWPQLPDVQSELASTNWPDLPDLSAQTSWPDFPNLSQDFWPDLPMPDWLPGVNNSGNGSGGSNPGGGGSSPIDVSVDATIEDARNVGRDIDSKLDDLKKDIERKFRNGGF